MITFKVGLPPNSGILLDSATYMGVLCEFSDGWCNIHLSNVDSPKSLFYARTRVKAKINYAELRSAPYVAAAPIATPPNGYHALDSRPPYQGVISER